MRSGITRLAMVAATTAALVGGLFAAVGHAANNSEQVVFSGTGFGNFAGTPSPFGFWIWCEATSHNPYAGNCAGSMYFYALGLVKHVGGDNAITEPQDGQYVITISSRDGSVGCTLINTPPITQGPTNTVSVSCSAPGGGGASTNAVGHATGP